MADKETTDEILEEEYSEADVKAALKFLERFPYTTTALACIAAALDELDASDQATYMREGCRELAEIEADEI